MFTGLTGFSLCCLDYFRQNCEAHTGCRLCAIVRHCIAKAYCMYVRAMECGKSAQDTQRRLVALAYCMASLWQRYAVILFEIVI